MIAGIMSDLRETIRRIKESADIVAIVGRHTKLERVGGRWKGLCPFHTEKTPSFHVRPDIGSFHCFGCQAGGSVIDFVMRTERMEFMDAVGKLAADLGIPLPQRGGAPRESRDEAERLRRQIAEANREALAFFQSVLARGLNPRANAYLPERGLGEALVARFQLGAAPDAWSALRDHLVRQGYTEEFLLAAGLVARSEEKGTFYDRFRDRLIFPIIDPNGQVLAFGGRALQKDDRTAKYINSVETALYRKSRHLYALNLAMKPIQETGHAILCEGYMDVVTCHAFGFPQAVASLGTALTAEQARLLRRYTSRVFFLYDGDAAGVKAMMEGGLALLAAGLDARVIELPEEHDPDTFLRQPGGPEALRERIRTAREFIDFAIEKASAGLELASISGQAELVERLAPYLRVITSEALREAAAARVAQHVAIPRETILRVAARQAIPARAVVKGEEPPSGASVTGAPSAHGRVMERNLLKMVLESEEARDIVRDRLEYEWLTDARVEAWLYFLLENDAPVSSLLSMLEAGELSWPGDRRLVTELLAWEVPMQARRDVEVLLLRLHERHRLRVAEEMREALAALPAGQGERLLAALHREHMARMAQASGQLRRVNRRPRR